MSDPNPTAPVGPNTNARPVELSVPLLIALQQGSTSTDGEDLVVNVILATWSAESAWLASSNPVYLEVGIPALIVMSANLLRPRLARQVGRLHPGFCPYVPTLAPNQAGQIQDLMSNALAAGESAVGDISHRTERFSWLRYTKISENPLEYEVGNSEMSSLTFAVYALALLLAAVGGLVLTAVVLKAINLAVLERAKSSMIQKRVDKKAGTIDDHPEPTKTAVPGPAVSTSQPLSVWASLSAWWSQKKRQEKSAAMESDIKSVFDVVASVGEAIYKALSVNPLKSFRVSLKANDAKGSKTSTKKYSKLFEDFRSDLEQFCCRERLSVPQVNLSEDGRKLLRKHGFNLTIRATQAVFTNLKKKEVASSNEHGATTKDEQEYKPRSKSKLKRKEVLERFFSESYDVSDFSYHEVAVKDVRREFERLNEGIILRNSDVVAQGCKVIDRDHWNVSLSKIKSAPWWMESLSRARVRGLLRSSQRP